MTLFETTQTLLRWARSCENAEQLKLMEEIIAEFISKRFADADPIELAEAESDLRTEISDRKSILAKISLQI